MPSLLRKSIVFYFQQSELNYLAFDDTLLLEPEFKPRIQYYTYNSTLQPTYCTISLNPNTEVEIKLLSNDIIVYSRTHNTLTIIIPLIFLFFSFGKDFKRQ